MMAMLILMTSFEGLGDEHRRQVCKNVCLYEGDQHFDQVDKERKQDEEGRCSPAQSDIHGAEDKDQADKAEDNDMPRDHIGKKPDDQGKRFREDTHDLHRPHDHLDRSGDGRIDDTGGNYDRSGGSYAGGLAAIFIA